MGEKFYPDNGRSLIEIVHVEGPKHTPGPWSLPHFAEPDVNCQCGYVMCGNLMGPVATVHCAEGDNWAQHGDSPEFLEAVANARLIAAAPDMFETLQKLASVMETGSVSYDEFIESRNLAKITINKAIGAA